MLQSLTKHFWKVYKAVNQKHLFHWEKSSVVFFLQKCHQVLIKLQNLCLIILSAAKLTVVSSVLAFKSSLQQLISAFIASKRTLIGYAMQTENT